MSGGGPSAWTPMAPGLSAVRGEGGGVEGSPEDRGLWGQGLGNSCTLRCWGPLAWKWGLLKAVRGVPRARG